MSTHLEVFAEGFGADSTLQLRAAAQTAAAAAAAAVDECGLRNSVTRGGLVVVTQQFVLAAELQVAHVTGEELHPHMREGVGVPSCTVWKGGATHPAESVLGQVRVGVTSDGGRVCWEWHRADFT